MIMRKLNCVFIGAALCAFCGGAQALASFVPASFQKVAAVNVGVIVSDASEDVVAANLLPTQYAPNNGYMPGVLRPIIGGLTGANAQQPSQQQPSIPRGTVRPRPATSSPAERPVPTAIESAVTEESIAAQEPEVPELHISEADAPVAADAPVLPDTPADPADGAAALDLGNDEASAPDAAVEAPEGEVSAADVKAAQTPAPAADSGSAVSSNSSKVWRYVGAEKAVADMTNDLLENLRKAGGNELYERWRSYNASIRRRTDSLQTGNELNSRCRLKWYERLYQDPLRSVGEAEKASHLFAQCFMGSSDDVVAGSRYARFLTDVTVRQNHIATKAASSPEEAIEMLKAALVEAASHHAKAIAPMGKNDLEAVKNETHKIFCGQVQSGHTVEMRGRAMYLIDAMEKMNKSEMYEAGESVLTLLHPQTLEQLRHIDFASLQKVRTNDGGPEVGLINTEAGDILIGGPEKNVWELDRYPNACCVVDLGGDDVYREGSCILNRPLLVVIDLGKSRDEYTGKNVAIQGGAILGVSVWYDDGGDDTYVAKDVCQGSAIAGFGVLINEEGNDRYLGFLREQGTAICGFGLLLDRAGNDDYRGALFAQGVGGPGGYGAIVDRSGDDHYFVGGYYFDSYPEHPGYDGWGQGVGAGIRRVACGGVGMLLDGSGDDAYEFDYFGHGGGYWMGIGIARDFSGNDVRYAATSTMYDGTARREKRWQRFGCGFGCHYACGYLFDDLGDDVYGGTIMGTGMGWDLGAGFLVDFLGNDTFEANGGLTQGAGGEGSIGVIMNYRGRDSYLSSYVGYANTSLTYHAQSNCGANFSFVVDHGGIDQYGASDNYRRTIQNNSITQRGNITGMIIDRPAPDEEQPTEASATSGQRASVTANGFAATPSSIKTMVAPPPLYDTNPHATSSGTNAFNPSSTDVGGRGMGLFGGRLFQ